MPEISDFGSHDLEGLFAALFATAVDGIIVIDPKGVILLYNQACERLFGFGAGEVLGQNVKMLMAEPYRGEHDGYFANYSRSGEKRIIGIGRDVMGRRKNGSTFPMYLSVGEGGLTGQRFFVGIIHDQSQIRQEMAQREGSDRLLAQIVASSDDAIISKTLEGIITSWNASAERIFGHSAAEAIGRHISLIFRPNHLDEEDQIVAMLKAGRDVSHHETVRVHKDGRLVQVSLAVAPIHDSAGRLIGASKTARDITEKKRAEEHLMTMRNELAHVGRLSAMGQMSAAIAHELNQPLTAVANYVKAAQRLLEASASTSPHVARAREAVQKAAAQTLRAGTIIRYLRDFVEKRESRKSLENLNEVIREAVSLGMLGQTHTSVKLTLTLDPALPPAPMDKVQIQQVLLNLIRNAEEAMADTPVPQLWISAVMEGHNILVTVRDNGPGLAQEVAERLFQPFVSTKADGMGIGLKLCQSIVESHSGTIEAQDARPGVAFLIRLPFFRTDPAKELT